MLFDADSADATIREPGMTKKRHNPSIVLVILSTFVLATTSLSWARESQLLVASRKTSNILRYDADTGKSLGIFNKTGHATQRLSNPKAMALGPDASLYVIRGFPDNDVVRVDSAGRFRGVVVSPDHPKLELPRGLAFRWDGSLYLSDRDANRVAIYKESAPGQLRVFIENGTDGLEMPRALTFDPGNRYLYVASRRNRSILRYDADTGKLAQTLRLPDPDLIAGQRNMKFGPDAHLYVTSYDNHSILKFDARGAFVRKVISGGKLVGPKGIAFGPDGNMYLTSHSTHHSCVLRYTLDGTFVDEFVARQDNGGLDDPTDLIFVPVPEAEKD